MPVRLSFLTALVLAVLLPLPLQAAQKLALFDFELVNTSMEPTRQDELARLATLRPLAAERLAKAGYELVDIAPAAAETAKVSSLRGCNGCDLTLARGLGAELAAVGWVQKVSNLILNINLQIRDAATGALVKVGSVDIRGNTDESWRRGLIYLLDHRIIGK